MSKVIIENEHNYSLEPQRLTLGVKKVIARHDVDVDSSVSIVLTTNKTVQTLNHQHRGIDAPTDILSFPASPLPPDVAIDEAPYLGDLIIAYPYAKEQAERLNHSLTDSLVLLVVHGTLHLLGYDHDTPENRAEMWAEQSHILAELGISDNIVPSLEESDHV